MISKTKIAIYSFESVPKSYNSVTPITIKLIVIIMANIIYTVYLVDEVLFDKKLI